MVKINNKDIKKSKQDKDSIEQNPELIEKDAAISDAAVETEESKQQGDAEDISGDSSYEEMYNELNGRYVRLLAEYDNYRKRNEREFLQLIATANENLMSELLPILDNLDRATEHKDKTTLEEYVKGIALIEDQLRDVLAKVGLKTMDVIGKEFDPTIHDAILQMESEEYEAGTVTGEAEKGYMLRGKVIRHPKVIVSK